MDGIESLKKKVLLLPHYLRLVNHFLYSSQLNAILYLKSNKLTPCQINFKDIAYSK